MFYLPSKKSLKLALAGDLFDPLTTAKLSRVGLEPNLSRMLEQDRKRSESVTAPGTTSAVSGKCKKFVKISILVVRKI